MRRRRRNGFLHTLHAHEDRENSHRALPGVAAIVHLVHCLGQGITLAIDALPLRTIIDGQLAFENIAEQRNGVGVPSRLLSGLQYDLHRGYQSGRALTDTGLARR